MLLYGGGVVQNVKKEGKLSTFLFKLIIPEYKIQQRNLRVLKMLPFYS